MTAKANNNAAEKKQQERFENIRANAVETVEERLSENTDNSDYVVQYYDPLSGIRAFVLEENADSDGEPYGEDGEPFFLYVERDNRDAVNYDPDTGPNSNLDFGSFKTEEDAKKAFILHVVEECADIVKNH